MKQLKKIALFVVALVLSLFTLASCDKEPVNSGAEAATKKIMLMQDKQTAVTADFEVSSIVKGDNGVTYNVAWTSNTPVVSFGEADQETKLITATVAYNPSLKEDANVKLTATVTNPDNAEDKASKEFGFTVPKFVASTCADYDKAKKGDTITLKGVITAKESYSASYKNTSVYIACEDGGFEAYRLACASQEAYDKDLKIGNTIYVTGTIATYNGLRELNPCTYMTDDTANSVKAATDITESVLAGNLPTKAIQCHPVKLTNISVVSVNGTTIVVGDQADKSKQITVKVSKYLTPEASDEYKLLTGLIAGDVVTIEGVVGWYNNVQIIPLTASFTRDYSNGFANEVKTAANVPAQVYGIKEIVLANEADIEANENYTGMTATWTSNSDKAVVGTKTIVVTPAQGTEGQEGYVPAVTRVVPTLTTAVVTEDTDVTLTLTVKVGEEVKTTETITIKLLANVVVDSHETYVNAEDDTVLYVKGTVTQFVYFKKHVYIVDEDGNGYYIYNGTALDVEIGDLITVSAKKGSYNNTLELVDVVILATEEGTATPTDITTDLAANGLTVTEATQGKFVSFTGKYKETTKTSSSSTTCTFEVGEGEDVKNIVVYFNNVSLPTYVVAGQSYKITGNYANTKSGENIISQIVVYTADYVEDLRSAEVRAQLEVDAIKTTIGTTKFESNAEKTLNLMYKDSTLTITVDNGGEAVVWNATTGKLTITPAQAAVSVTVTISVKIGDQTKTADITVEAQLPAIVDDTIKVDTFVPVETSIPSKDASNTTDYASLVGLDDTHFSVKLSKNNGTTMTYLQYTETRLYWDNSTNADGSSIKISVEEVSGYTLTITSIKVTWSAASNKGTVLSGTTALVDVDSNETDVISQYEVNGTSFEIKNTNTTNVPVKFKTIEITYTFVPNAA